jgi:hypothetical protein
LLQVVEADEPSGVRVEHQRLVLAVRPDTSTARRLEVLDAWYRDEVRREAPPLIAKWEAVLGVKVRRLYVRRMRTRWGSCNPRTGAVRLNTDLAKKPRECLDYIVLHELVHMLERGHGPRFKAHLDRLMPQWKHYRQVLNRLPVRHEDWEC